MVDDPITMLRDALQGQTLTHITRLIVTTENAGGVSNIPFITANADTQVVESVFAIERVQGPDDTEVMQLQYSQTALLNFARKVLAARHGRHADPGLLMSTTAVDSNGRVTTGKTPAARRQVAGTVVWPAGTHREPRPGVTRRQLPERKQKRGESLVDDKPTEAADAAHPGVGARATRAAVAAPSHSSGPGARARLLAGHLRRDGGHDLPRPC